MENQVETYSASAELKDLFMALSKAQAEMKPAIMDMKNPHYGSTYASLTSCQDAYRGPLSKNGLAIIQQIFSIEQTFYCRSVLGHVSGQWISNVFRLITDKNNMQGLGSAITYARRYGANSLVGVVDTEDDDGGGAIGKQPPQQPVANKIKAEQDRLAAQAKKDEAEYSQAPTTPLGELTRFVKEKKMPAEVIKSIMARVTGTEKLSTEMSNEELQKVLDYLKLMK